MQQAKLIFEEGVEAQVGIYWTYDNLKSKVAALEQQSQSDAIVVELKQSNDRLQMLWAATRTLAVAMAKDPVHLDTLLSNLHDQFIANK